VATRARLLEAAESLFTHRGYEATAMSDVSREAGVAVGTMYHHFTDKRALLLALIDAWGDALVRRRRSEVGLETVLGDDPHCAVHAWLVRSYERLRKRPSLYLVVLSLAGRDAEVRERYRRIEAAAIERLRTLLEIGQARGVVRSSCDPAAAAFLVHNMIDMAATQLLVREVPGTPVDAVLRELASMICRYILEDPR
jgi:AcrR family transcriptional regulator